MKNLTDFRKMVETGVNSHLLVVLSSNPQPCLKIQCSQLVCLRKVGVLNTIMFDLNYLFQAFT